MARSGPPNAGRPRKLAHAPTQAEADEHGSVGTLSVLLVSVIPAGLLDAVVNARVLVWTARSVDVGVTAVIREAPEHADDILAWPSSDDLVAVLIERTRAATQKRSRAR